MFYSFGHIGATNVEEIKGLDGILVAPGFGKGGIEGKKKRVRYARENKVPFRNLFGDANGHSEYSRNVFRLLRCQFDRNEWHTKYPVVNLMEDQKT
jgi:CTP synthase